MFLTESQISQMADAALLSYEVAADKNAAIQAAKEFCIDEFGVQPSRGAILTAWNRAYAAWREIQTQTKNVI